MAKLVLGYVLHHKDPSWRHNDIERYKQWNIEDLIVMKKSDHQKLHMGEFLSEDWRRKHSEALKGKPSGMKGKHHTEEWKRKHSEVMSEVMKGIGNSFFGKHHSEETKKKISESRNGWVPSEDWRRKHSEALKGKPSGMKGKNHTEEWKRKHSEALKGMFWWNNGIVNMKARECPDESWSRGKLKKHNRGNENEKI